MRHLSNVSKGLLEALLVEMNLIEGIPNSTGKLDRGGECIMAIHGEWVEPNMLSLSHYYEQEGDLLADPEMLFWKGDDGEYYPVLFKQDGAFPIRHQAIFFSPERRPLRHDKKVLSEQVHFVSTWLRNICFQQGIEY